MPRFSSQIQKLLALLLITISVNSCDPGCVEAYEFDTESRYIKAKPENEGIYGDYNDTTGGQIAGWTNTNLRSNGEPLIISVSGSWTGWDDATNPEEINLLPDCTMCFKKKDATGNLIANCICEAGQTPEPEKDTFGNPLNVDCSDPITQENPNLCTCTQQQGSTENPGGVYSIAINYQNKDESIKIPDEQFACKYSKGFGLYVGLFGKNGYTIPTRIYHIYPTEEICDIPRNADGECKGDDNIDQTKHIYRSPNNLIFVKDDLAGNDGSDTTPFDDVYHKAGEYIKLIINDRYYSDNYGGYNVEFLGGFSRAGDSSLLEYIVGIIEDALLGKVDENGKRDGGVIKFMYNSIVQDSVFILILQLFLILYITVYGIFVISGSIEVTRKGLMMRVLQISLVALFTTETSWYFYNQLVVGFFKDSMDFLITLFMAVSDNTVDQSSLIITSQVDRASAVSHATRFSYADVIIRKLFSAASSKKILGLFFSDFFGFIYIAVIYVLIFGFLGVMVFAALMYVKILVAIVLLLSLGPIFIVMILFSKTKEIFKRWLAILASQSLQIIGLFLIVYLFAVLIDKGFNELLYYKTCTKSIPIGWFHIDFYVADIYRSIGVWFLMFMKIGAMIFLLFMIIQQIPSFIGRLVVVDGQKADVSSGFIADTRASSTRLAKDLFSRMRGFATTTWNKKGFSATGTMGGAGRYMASGPAGMARGLGLEKTADKMNKYGPLGLYNSYQLNKLIRQKQAEKGGDKASIRAAVIAEARKRGFDDDATIERLNQKLSIDPLNKAIRNEFKNLKKEGFKDIFDEEKLRAELERRLSANPELDKSRIAEAVANRNLVVGYEDAAKMAARDKDLIDKYMALDESQKLKYKKFWGALGYGKESMNNLFAAELHQNMKDDAKDRMSIKDRLVSTYNRSNFAGVMDRVTQAGYYDTSTAITKAIGAKEGGHDNYMSEVEKWQKQQEEKFGLQEYRRVLEDEKARVEKSKSDLDAELNKMQNKADTNNAESEKQRAEGLKKALKEYEDNKLKLNLWREQTKLELERKGLDPQKDSKKIRELDKKIADLTRAIDEIDKKGNN